MSPRNAIAFEVQNGSHPDAKKGGAYWFMYRWTEKTPSEITSDRIGIQHACPCGCGGKGTMWFRGGSLNGSGHSPGHEWDVTGEWPKVTLSPSIGFAKDKVTGRYHWHGYLENGVFVER